MSYKHYLEDLKKGQFKCVYLFYGEEGYLMEKLVLQTKEKIVDPTFEEFNFQVIDGETTDFDTVLQAMETLPLMQDQKVIVVKNAPYFKQVTPTDAQFNRYKALLAMEQSSFLVIFICSDGVDKRKKIYKESLIKGQAVEFHKLDAKDFEKWLLKHFKTSGIEVEQSVMSDLVAYLGYLDYHSTKSLYQVEGEIKQLSDYTGKRPLKTEDIRAVLIRSIEGNIFVVIDAFSDGHQKHAMALVGEMLLNGEPEIRILFMLARHFRQLYRMKAYLNGGIGLDIIAQEMKLQRFQVQKLMHQCRSVQLNDLALILKRIEKADYSIKTGGMTSKVALDYVLGHFYLLYSS